MYDLHVELGSLGMGSARCNRADTIVYVMICLFSYGLLYISEIKQFQEIHVYSPEREIQPLWQSCRSISIVTLLDCWTSMARKIPSRWTYLQEPFVELDGRSFSDFGTISLALIMADFSPLSSNWNFNPDSWNEIHGFQCRR